MNLNSLVRSKQRRLFAIILAAAAVIIGGLYLANRGVSGHSVKKADKPDSAAAEPDLTGGGVVNTFDGSGQGSLLVSAQNREKEAREQLASMQKDFKSLKDQMSDVMNNNKSLQQNVSDLMDQLKNQQDKSKTAPSGQQGAGKQSCFQKCLRSDVQLTFHHPARYDEIDFNHSPSRPCEAALIYTIDKYQETR